MSNETFFSQLDRRDEVILGIVAAFIPLLGIAAMLY